MATDVQVKVPQRHLKDLERCDAMWRGYVGSEKQLQELELDMANALLKFSTTSSRINTGMCEYAHFQKVLLVTAIAFVSAVGTAQAGVLKRKAAPSGS